MKPYRLCVSTEHRGSSQSSDSKNARFAEAQLVEAAQADPSAFGEIYMHYVRRVYRFLRAQAASEEDAEDMTQQVFLQALDALSKYQERGLPFAAWLFTISRNVANDVHRRRQNSTATLNWEALPQKLQPIDPHNYE